MGRGPQSGSVSAMPRLTLHSLPQMVAFTADWGGQSATWLSPFLDASQLGSWLSCQRLAVSSESGL